MIELRHQSDKPKKHTNTRENAERLQRQRERLQHAQRQSVVMGATADLLNPTEPDPACKVVETDDDEDDVVTFDGFGAAMRSQIVHGDKLQNVQQSRCQRWLRLLLGEGMQQLLAPDPVTTVKMGGTVAEEAVSAAEVADVVEGRASDAKPLTESQVMEYLSQQIVQDQFCVSFPAMARIDVIKQPSGRDASYYRRFHRRLVDQYVLLLCDHCTSITLGGFLSFFLPPCGIGFV